MNNTIKEVINRTLILFLVSIVMRKFKISEKRPFQKNDKLSSAVSLAIKALASIA